MLDVLLKHFSLFCFLCRFVGPYTFFSPSLSFILEDDIGVCGYVLAALDSRSFYDQFTTEWAPEVAKNYPLPHVGIKELTPEEVRTCMLGLEAFVTAV